MKKYYLEEWEVNEIKDEIKIRERRNQKDNDDLLNIGQLVVLKRIIKSLKEFEED